MEGNRCSNQPWGFLATDVADPPACIADCRQKFLRGLSLEDETLETVCEALTDNGNTDIKDEMFWALYCCDAQLCGVDNLKGGGDDRTLPPMICSRKETLG